MARASVRRRSAGPPWRRTDAAPVSAATPAQPHEARTAAPRGTRGRHRRAGAGAALGRRRERPQNGRGRWRARTRVRPTRWHHAAPASTPTDAVHRGGRVGTGVQEGAPSSARRRVPVDAECRDADLDRAGHPRAGRATGSSGPPPCPANTAGESDGRPGRPAGAMRRMETTMRLIGAITVGRQEPMPAATRLPAPLELLMVPDRTRWDTRVSATTPAIGSAQWHDASTHS